MWSWWVKLHHIGANRGIWWGFRKKFERNLKIGLNYRLNLSLRIVRQPLKVIGEGQQALKQNAIAIH
jgi:hypothetical protein